MGKGNMREAGVFTLFSLVPIRKASLTKRGGEPPRAKAVTGHRTPNYDSTDLLE
jgi:hypothetical protein